MINNKCVTEWECTGWTECSTDGTQTRICTYSQNYCEPETEQPEETRFCDYVEETEETGEDTVTTEIEETEETEDTGFFAGITGAFIGTLGTGGSIALILTVLVVLVGFFLIRYINNRK